MPEREKTLNSPEDALINECFGHLFPGNQFNDLPLQSIQTVGYTFETVAPLLHPLSGGLKDNSILPDLDYAERKNLTQPNQYVMSVLLQNAHIRAGRIQGTRFDRHSFADLVHTDRGESLGGAVEKHIQYHLFMKSAVQFAGGDPHRQVPLVLLGVLNKNHKPAAIIYFIEPRSPRMVKEKEPVALRLARTPQLRGSAI